MASEDDHHISRKGRQKIRTGYRKPWTEVPAGYEIRKPKSKFKSKKTTTSGAKGKPKAGTKRKLKRPGSAPPTNYFSAADVGASSPQQPYAAWEVEPLADDGDAPELTAEQQQRVEAIKEKAAMLAQRLVSLSKKVYRDDSTNLDSGATFLPTPLAAAVEGTVMAGRSEADLPQHATDAGANANVRVEDMVDLGDDEGEDEGSMDFESIGVSKLSSSLREGATTDGEVDQGETPPSTPPEDAEMALLRPSGEGFLVGGLEEDDMQDAARNDVIDDGNETRSENLWDDSNINVDELLEGMGDLQAVLGGNVVEDSEPVASVTTEDGFPNDEQKPDLLAVGAKMEALEPPQQWEGTDDLRPAVSSLEDHLQHVAALDRDEELNDEVFNDRFNEVSSLAQTIVWQEQRRREEEVLAQKLQVEAAAQKAREEELQRQRDTEMKRLREEEDLRIERDREAAAEKAQVEEETRRVEEAKLLAELEAEREADERIRVSSPNEDDGDADDTDSNAYDDDDFETSTLAGSASVGGMTPKSYGGLTPKSNLAFSPQRSGLRSSNLHVQTNEDEFDDSIDHTAAKTGPGSLERDLTDLDSLPPSDPMWAATGQPFPARAKAGRPGAAAAAAAAAGPGLSSKFPSPRGATSYFADAEADKGMLSASELSRQLMGEVQYQEQLTKMEFEMQRTQHDLQLDRFSPIPSFLPSPSLLHLPLTSFLTILP
jgi:hypothetical protein